MCFCKDPTFPRKVSTFSSHSFLNMSYKKFDSKLYKCKDCVCLHCADMASTGSGEE